MKAEGRRKEKKCLQISSRLSFYSSPSKNRKAFTLIEVMVATIIISVVGLSLLQMHTNSANMSHTMQKKFAFSDWALMGAFENKVEKRKKNLRYDTLMKSFNIDERSIREGLNRKGLISTTLIERIDSASIKKQMDEADLDLPVSDALRLEIYQQSIEVDGQVHSLYRMIKP